MSRPGFHRHFLAGALDHDHVLDGGAAFERLVHDVLELDDLAVLEAPSQVMTSFDWLSSMRPCRASTEKPP